MLFVMALTVLVGCSTPIRTNSGVTASGSTSLTSRPDFDAARKAAPAWAEAALNENTDLRAEIKELKNK
jgi:hypothetical protein